jgi:hypothetical protein
VELAWWERLLVAGLSLMVALVFATIAWVVYAAATGGFTYTERIREDGVTCVAVRSRLTGEVESVSCPARQGPQGREVR